MSYMNFNAKMGMLTTIDDIVDMISTLESMKKTKCSTKKGLGEISNHILDLIKMKSELCDILLKWKFPSMEFIISNHTKNSNNEPTLVELKFENDMVFETKVCTLEFVKRLKVVSTSITEEFIEYGIEKLNEKKISEQMNGMMEMVFNAMRDAITPRLNILDKNIKQLTKLEINIDATIEIMMEASSICLTLINSVNIPFNPEAGNYNKLFEKLFNRE